MMENPEEIPDLVKCPYCGAGNPPAGEFCGACHRKLYLPRELKTAVNVRNILAAAGAAPPGPGPAAEERPASRLWGRLALIGGLFIFYLQWLREDKYFSLLDYVNLAFHEAGHVFLGFFGRFIMMAGGTIFQLLIPALCLAHFKRKGANLGWQLCLFWIGQSLLNISIYAGDAIRQELPLVGGGEHDWTYLLTELGLIAHPEGVARAIFLAGTALIFWSFWLIALDAKNREPVELGDVRLY